MKCIALVVMMALATTNGQLPGGLYNYANYAGFNGLSYRGLPGAFGHPFSAYSPYYGARFGYEAPLPYGGVPALPPYSPIPPVYAAPNVVDSAVKTVVNEELPAYKVIPHGYSTPFAYAAPTVVDSAFKTIVKEAPIPYESLPAAYPLAPTAYSPLAYDAPFAPAPYSQIPAAPFATPYAAPYTAPFAAIPPAYEVGVPKATFVAKTPGVTFEAALPGHWQSVVAENLDLAPTVVEEATPKSE